MSSGWAAARHSKSIDPSFDWRAIKSSMISRLASFFSVLPLTSIAILTYVGNLHYVREKGGGEGLLVSKGAADPLGLTCSFPNQLDFVPGRNRLAANDKIGSLPGERVLV